VVFLWGDSNQGGTIWNSTEWKKEPGCKLGKYFCSKTELQGIQRGMSKKTSWAIWNYQEYDWKQS